MTTPKARDPLANALPAGAAPQSQPPQSSPPVVRLIDKGSTLIGTAAHGLGNGLDRVFVLWQTIRTEPLYDQYGIPHQYDVAVNSPATEENGENGLPGDV